MFLKKQFAFLNEEAASRGISLDDLVRAFGPQGMNLGVSTDPLCACTAGDVLCCAFPRSDTPLVVRTKAPSQLRHRLILQRKQVM